VPPRRNTRAIWNAFVVARRPGCSCRCLQSSALVLAIGAIFCSN
jgi:hypothetical protein